MVVPFTKKKGKRRLHTNFTPPGKPVNAKGNNPKGFFCSSHLQSGKGKQNLQDACFFPYVLFTIGFPAVMGALTRPTVTRSNAGRLPLPAWFDRWGSDPGS
jgi:hypothetical protein